MTSTTSTTRTDDAHVAEAFVAMLEALHRDPAPFWGYVHVRHLELRQHPAWHVNGYTVERTCTDGPTEQYRIVREPRSAFFLRMQEMPVIGQPHPDDVKFTVTVKLRYPLTDRKIWSLCLTHNDTDQLGRTKWQRRFDATVKCDHFVADKSSGVFRPCRPGFEQIRMVSGMELDLPEGLRGLFLGYQVA